ncbi:hypothetical protein FACS1894167_14520 [Synergistales bacterium]|nr:hypothetical protein FACS1894167_14520 [Synergistales bacterium]
MPSIIDKETFDKVQVKMAHNKRNAGHFKARRVYMLSGLIKCGECGSLMWGKSHFDGRHGLEYLNYECSAKGYKQNCDSRGVRKESIENYVLDELQNTLFSEVSMKKLAAMLSAYSVRMKDSSKIELDGALNELAEIKVKVDRIIQLVADSGISINVVKDELKRLEDRKITIEACIQEIQMRNNAAAVSEDMIIGLINKSKESVRLRNIAECREFIGNYVESVIVHREKVEIRFKIGVPDTDNDTLSPLTVEYDLEELKDKYRKAG